MSDRFIELGITEDSELIKKLQEENILLRKALDEKTKEIDILKKTFEETIANITAITIHRNNLPLDENRIGNPIWVAPEYIPPYNSPRPYDSGFGPVTTVFTTTSNVDAGNPVVINGAENNSSNDLNERERIVRSGFVQTLEDIPNIRENISQSLDRYVMGIDMAMGEKTSISIYNNMI